MSNRVQRVLDRLVEPDAAHTQLRSVGQMLDGLTQNERRDLAARLNARWLAARQEQDRFVCRLASQLKP